LSLLIDSSVWIDYFNGAVTPQTDHLDNTLGSELVVTGDLILAEVLQGFKEDRDYELARDMLLKLPVLGMVGREITERSAENFRSLRKKGVTVRKTIDCSIATFCIENGLTILHSDRDFDPFEQHLGLKVRRP
jgi:predicted nucleic acid-binding protein